MPSIQEEAINQMERKICGVSIDIRMIPTKIAFFLFSASVGAFIFFRNIFLISVGLTASEAGFISGMCYVASGLMGPIVGILADHTDYRKLIFIILYFGAGLLTFSTPLVARSVRKTASINHNTSINVSSTSLPGNADGVDYKGNLIPFASTLFVWMLVLSVTLYSLVMPGAGLLDSIATNIIKTSQTKETYGKQRMIGSLGFGVANLISGVLVNRYHQPNMSK